MSKYLSFQQFVTIPHLFKLSTFIKLAEFMILKITFTGPAEKEQARLFEDKFNI